MFGRWERRVCGAWVGALDARSGAVKRLGIVMLLTAALLVNVAPSALAGVIYSEVPIDGWDTNGRVLVVKVHGDTVYLGGEFTEVRSADGNTVLPRSNVAAIDITNGDILPFVADANTSVKAIETDGSTVWIGGTFNNVNGEHRSNLAAVEATSGALKSFDVSTNGSVQGLALLGGRLYAGGYFTNIEGVAQQRVASLDPVTGLPDAQFQANADAGVRDLAASADGRLFVGGFFTTIGNQPWAYLAELDPATGGGVGPGYTYMIAPMLDIDVSPDGAFVFAAVAGFQNRASAWNTFDGERRWYHRVMGDTQAVSYYEGVLYFGFHEGFEGDETLRLLAADVVTGELQDFYPSINSFYGVWAIDAESSGLAIGGEFSVVSGVATRGVAVFESDGTQPDMTSPSKPRNVRMLGASGGAVQLEWDASTDNRAVSHYRIYREGELVGATAETQFADSTAAEGVEYDYTVRASDLAGNLSSHSNPLTVRTWISAIDAGDTWRHEDSPQISAEWRLDDFDDASWSVGSAQFGFGDGDEVTLLQSGRTTYYFRKTFTVPAGQVVVDANLRLVRDDGAVVYVNGVEVLRDNLPSGEIEPDTRALTTISGDAERQWLLSAVANDVFVSGTNVVEVEIHQKSPGSSDVSFDFTLDIDLAGEVIDDEPPTKPTGFSVDTRTSRRVHMDWNASSDNEAVAGYRVYRDDVEIAFVQATEYLDIDLVPETEYVYRVYAVDESGNVSDSSAVRTATTYADTAPPKKPRQVSTTATPNSIAISWNHARDNYGISHYIIKSHGQLMGTTSGTSFTIDGLEPETNYHVSVRAVDLYGNRGPRVNRWRTTPPVTTSYQPIDAGHQWRYLDDGANLGSAWTAASFSDDGWETGVGEFGYGDGDENTVIEGGPSQDRHITTYFRSDFQVPNASAVTSLELGLLRDDGAVVYINGVEVFRDNLPAGPIDAATLALTGISGPAEDDWLIADIPFGALVDGENVIAVEIHQQHRTSSDVSFNLTLRVNP
ncbi:MAG: hypothetical protein HKN91_10775 [Acidimicrobiia bacterium]|nr:hypothetical protein [Acidimicrobiia bacterium]